jgi:molybdate transport system regulatory protein
MEKEIEKKIRAGLVNGKLPCAVAFKIAEDLKVSTREVGDEANRLKIKICNCRLGCFP